MLCLFQFKDTCPAGVHKMTWKCHEGRPASCPACDRLVKALERQAILDIKVQEERDKAQHEYDAKMTELQANLQYQQEGLNDLQQQKARENDIKQKVKEIEDAKKKIVTPRMWQRSR